MLGQLSFSRFIVGMFIAWLALAACVNPAPVVPTNTPTGATQAPVATAVPTQAAVATKPAATTAPVTLPTIPPTPVVAVSPTAPPAAMPTLPAVTPAPQANCVPLDPMFEALRTRAQNLPQIFPYPPAINCPQRPIASTYGAIQEFRQPITAAGAAVLTNYILWREDNKAIYLVAKADQPTGVAKVYPYEDTWADNQPAIMPECAAIVAPQDAPPPADPNMALQVPRRGFGKVWCKDKWQDKIGFGVGKEFGTTFAIQETAGGVYISISSWPGHSPVMFLLDIQRGGALAP